MAQVETRASDPLETGRHDLPVSADLAAYLTREWDVGRGAAYRPLAPPVLCAARRGRLAALLPGERVVVPAGRPARRGNGQEFRFRPASPYVYLTGDASAGGVLVLGSDGATLYLDPPLGLGTVESFRDAERGDLWVGRRPSLDDVEEALGLACRPLGELALDGPARLLRGVDGKLDTKVATDDDFPDRELRAILEELRLVKDEWEIAQIEQAVAATIAAYEDLGRALPNAQSERDLEVAFTARARVAGNDIAFNPIVASGAHATTLHWTRNDGVLGRDALVLVDAGAESHSLYSADLTRTYPVGGRYTDVQRRVLELLNDVHEVALAAVRPGSKFHDFRTAAAEAMGEALADWGIIPSSISAEEAQRRFTICGPGHMLGLDVHDCAAARAAHYLDGVLEEGHVLTVEPGLYFQADDVSIPAELRGLGARVEDDVVVTSDGITNLSEALPRRPQAVEEWLAALREA